MRILLTIGWCLLALGLAKGQRDSLPYLQLKNNVSLLMHPRQPGFHLGLEYGFVPRFSVQLEGGPQLRWQQASEPTTDYFRGFRLRPALRYHLSRSQYNNYTTFLELMYEYRHTKAGIEGDFERFTPLGSYQQRLVYDFREQRQSLFLNLGIQQVFPSGFLWEFGAGLGTFSEERRYGGVPPNARFITNGSWIWQYGRLREEEPFAIMAYISLGYRF